MKRQTKILTNSISNIMNAPILTLTIWLTCSLLTYGWIFPYLQSLWPKSALLHKKKDRIASFIFSLGGPFSLAYFVIVIGDFKNKWRL
jgi:hypothetical protein